MPTVYVIPNQPVAFSNKDTAVKVAGDEDRVSALDVVDFSPEEMQVEPVMRVVVLIDAEGTLAQVTTSMAVQPFHGTEPHDYVTSYSEPTEGGMVAHVVEGVLSSKVYAELEQMCSQVGVEWDRVRNHLEWGV
jgi:hypothetical protein